MLSLILLLFCCLVFVKSMSLSVPASAITKSKESCEIEKHNYQSHFNWRLSLAGGLAGGITNAIFFPFDTLKTMRQSDKSLSSISIAFDKLIRSGPLVIYSGVLPAVLGSIPSSALYFGSYEASKSILSTVPHLGKTTIHIASAAFGNIISSCVFVPKEFLKQQLQAIKTGSIPWNSNPMTVSTLDVCKHVFKSRGFKGFYPNFRATLIRNIPGAVIRFSIYEEIKSRAPAKNGTFTFSHAKYLMAGCLASGLSSFVTTPLDVVKTRLATGMLPPGTCVSSALWEIAKHEGVGGLYAGAGIRILFATAFGGVGFTCYELCKNALRVGSTSTVASCAAH